MRLHKQANEEMVVFVNDLTKTIHKIQSHRLVPKLHLFQFITCNLHTACSLRGNELAYGSL